MVSLTDVRTHNASLKSSSPGLVAVFVGGTSGIGLTTAREFVRNTTSPHVYLIGRNESEASRIIPEFQTLNPSSKVDFIKSNVSLLREVDQVCQQIKEKESKVNILFMTPGYTTMNGNRDETPEGLDRKFSLHYYARMRFVSNLAPLLTAAADNNDSNANLSRVISILSPQLGRKSPPDFSDLSLKNNFSLKNCALHASVMNNFALEHFAQTYPGTSFVHAAPGIVQTNSFRELGPIAKVAAGFLIRLLKVDLQESGERHLFASTAPRFAPRGKAKGVDGVVRGSDEVVGSGAYNINWDGEVFPESKKAQIMRDEGAVERIWTHTEEVFGKIRGGEGKY